MKRFKILSCGLALALSVGAGATGASAAVRQNHATAPQVVRDPELEKESLHNLEVARHYFKLKKAYNAALQRCEEIIGGDPRFSRLDEVLYIAGLSSLRLSEGRGKQAPKVPVASLRDDARTYLSRIVNEFPQSKFRDKAEDELRALGGPKEESKQ